MRVIRTWLRGVRNVVAHLYDAVCGPNQYDRRRLERAGRLRYGAFSYGVPVLKTYMHDETKLIVGAYSQLSETATFMLGGEHGTSHVTTFPHRIIFGMAGAGEDGFPTRTPDTVVGSDVWVGQRAFVRSGVTIGHGAIVAAGAIVVKDVPPFAIVGGNPATVIRYRFSEQQITELLDIAWWNWPEDEVRAAVPVLAGDDVDAFIEWARSRGH